jgi:glutaminyl-tRNA synthetase
VAFGRTLFIEQDDFMEVAPGKKFFRLSVGGTVRLKSAYIITCNDVVKNATGEIEEVHCTYYSDSKSGSDTSGLSPKGTLHWIHAERCVRAEVRLYDRLFTEEQPDAHKELSFKELINPGSLQELHNVCIEPELAHAQPGTPFQFLRNAYFCADKTTTPNHPVFNRTVTLKDGFAKKS